MTFKSLRTTLTAGALTLALGSSALMVPSAAAEEKQGSLPAQCKTLVTGGTFNWGVKRSFRQYIQGISRGAVGAWRATLKNLTQATVRAKTSSSSLKWIPKPQQLKSMMREGYEGGYSYEAVKNHF